VVSAHAVYPAPNNAEGVVNAAWLDALREQWAVELLTSPHGYQSLAPPAANGCPVRVYTGTEEPRKAVDVIAAWTRFPKWHPLGMLARLADRGSRALSQMPVGMSMWVRRASRHILALQAGNAHTLPVWARGTPPESFQAAILAYWRRPFPLIINYNDPMPHCLLWGEKIGKLTPTLDRLQHRQNAFFSRHAQAFTFPSRRLAELMTQNAGFDSRRCFVLPHLTPTPRPTGKLQLGPGPWMLYAGSFYPTVFTAAVRNGLAHFVQQQRSLRIVMALKKPSLETRDWISKQLPGTVVFENISPCEMAQLKEQVQAIWVTDAPAHAPLLLTKVAEAVRAGLPIFAISSANSTTTNIVRQAGGTVVTATDTETIANALSGFEDYILDHARLNADAPARRQVAARFSESRVITDSTAIIDYACRRFAWQQAGETGAAPEPPQIEDWP